MKYDKRKLQTGVQVETEQTRNRAGLATLTPEEEKVVRMLHGLSEEDDHVLEFAVGASEDSRMRLAFMEAQNIAAQEGEVPQSGSAESAGLIEWMVARYGEETPS